jgi:hypothetical protein
LNNSLIKIQYNKKIIDPLAILTTPSNSKKLENETTEVTEPPQSTEEIWVMLTNLYFQVIDPGEVRLGFRIYL